MVAVAASGRLRLAQGGPAEALADFEKVRTLYSLETWGLEMQDNGFLHARSSTALALLQLGKGEEARQLAGQELSDARAFRAPRALGIALRVAGLANGDGAGMAMLEESSPEGPLQSDFDARVARPGTEPGLAFPEAGLDSNGLC